MKKNNKVNLILGTFKVFYKKGFNYLVFIFFMFFFLLKINFLNAQNIPLSNLRTVKVNTLLDTFWIDSFTIIPHTLRCIETDSVFYRIDNNLILKKKV